MLCKFKPMQTPLEATESTDSIVLLNYFAFPLVFVYWGMYFVVMFDELTHTHKQKCLRYQPGLKSEIF